MPGPQVPTQIPDPETGALKGMAALGGGKVAALETGGAGLRPQMPFHIFFIIRFRLQPKLQPFTCAPSAAYTGGTRFSPPGWMMNMEDSPQALSCPEALRD